jgi:ankyrin repeat protein
MAACFKGYSDIVQLLLDHHADTNAKDSKGDTALKIATRGGYTRIVELLKKSGARSDEPRGAQPPSPPAPPPEIGPASERTSIA